MNLGQALKIGMEDKEQVHEVQPSPSRSGKSSTGSGEDSLSLKFQLYHLPSLGQILTSCYAYTSIY